MPASMRTVIGAAVAAGSALLAYYGRVLASSGLPSARHLALVGLFGALLVVSWLRPLMIFVDDESEAVHLDEYFFIVLVMLVPPAATVLTFALATTVAQILRRRPLVKSAFNVGQVVLSASTGVAVYRAVLPPAHRLDVAMLAAAVAGAVAYLVVNSAAVAGVLIAAGSSWRDVVLGGLDVRLVFNAGSIAIALTTGLLV